MSFTKATLKTAIQDYTDNNETVFVNHIDDFIKANGQGAEETANANSVDFVSNGFKFRHNCGDMNGAGEYVYFAWAESPFKNARAR